MTLKEREIDILIFGTPLKNNLPEMFLFLLTHSLLQLENIKISFCTRFGFQIDETFCF